MGAHRSYRQRRFTFGNQLLTLRTRAALTQGALAEQLGVHLRSVQNWESGESYPKAELLQRLIAALLSRQAFTHGNERAEAEALWSMAAEDSPRMRAAFDEVWFGELYARHVAPATVLAEPLQERARGVAAPLEAGQELPRTVIDWGEAIAVPRLYGRDGELATLRQWVVVDRCRVVAILGLGGIGKSTLALSFAQRVVSQFEVTLFRSLQNGPALADVLDQIIRAVADEQAPPPDELPEKIALLVRLFRSRRCLLILDNVESIMQPGAPTGTYRDGYAEYGDLLHALSARDHQSCLLLTSREKPAELGPLEGRASPMRTLPLTGLDKQACRSILETTGLVGATGDVAALARLYGGNPLALHLVAEPIRELFGGDVGAFLIAGNAFFNGVDTLLEQQLARSTPLEQTILYWLAVEREPVPLSAALAIVGDAAPQREVLVALESLRRRMLIERAPDQPAFHLQPVIMEFVTDQLVRTVCRELAEGRPRLLADHALVQATAREHLRRSQERLIGLPVLEQLTASSGGAGARERVLLVALASWRERPLAEHGYGPGNLINLLRLLRGNLQGLDLARLAIRQAYLQGVAMQDTSLAGAAIQDSLFTDTFDVIQAVAVSSTGANWAAATRRGEVLVWAAGDLTTPRMWRAHTDMVWSLSFSPDGRTLASASWDGTVKLSDVASGAMIWSGHHASHVNSVAFSPNGLVLASGGNDAAVRLWDAQSGTLLQVLPHPGPVCGSGVTWSPDGRLLASGDLEGMIRVWDMSQPGPATCTLTINAHTSIVDGLAFAPDSGVLASASWDGTVKLWDVAGGRMRQQLAGHTGRMGRVAWSPDGRTLAVSGYDPTIWLWDIERSAYRTTLYGHTDGVCGLAFTPDSRTLLSCGNGVLRVWDAAGGQSLRVIQGYEDFVYIVDWSPDGAQLVSGSMDGLVTVWDASGGAPRRQLRGQSGSVCGVGWSPDGRYLASSEWENTIELWDAASGAWLQTIRHPEDAGNFFYGLMWSPDGQRLACGTSRSGILVWNLAAQGQQWACQPLPTFIRQVAWSPDGAWLAGAGDDGSVYIWQASDGALLRELTGHQSMVTSIAWSPDARWLASGGKGTAGGELFVWNTERWARVGTITDRVGNVYALAWEAGADRLVSGDGDGRLRWWDVRHGACVRVRDAHRGTVQALRRSPDGNRLASCGDDGAIMIWDLQTGEHLQTLRRDRPYERMNISGLVGISAVQRESLIALGAVDVPGAHQIAAGEDRAVAAGTGAPKDAISPLQHQQSVAGLPLQPTGFIGRADELAEIAGRLANPACRLLTLLGPGGIGKTRLALAVAGRHAAAFHDGVAFVGLASVDSPDQIASAIGDTLGLVFSRHADPTAELLASLAERHMLLILDNVEHLLAGSDLIARLLASAPHLTILATSRVRLNLRAEWLFDVGGLAYPPEDQSLLPAGMSGSPDLSGYSAIQLFVQRAAQVQPGLSLSESSLRIIARICERVAGIPLAIELAAAVVRSAPLAEIERQIGVSLDTLTTTHRDVPERHRSMRAVFEHSWNLLCEPERVLFSRLAVFRRGWTLAAAEQVAMATHRALATLAEASLVRREPAAAGRGWAPTAQEWRFSMLEPIREYALEQLEASGEAAALRQAHAAYYLALAEAAAHQWDTPTADAAIEQLDREHDNIRAALQWARDGGQPTMGLQIAGALRRFWRRRGYISEGRTWLEELLAQGSAPTDQAAQAARMHAMEAAAWLASDQHEYARATQLFEQSRALRRSLGQAEDETQLLSNAALEARAAGRYQRAAGLLEDIVARHRALGDRRSLSGGGLGQSLFLLGMVRREQGDFASAASLFAECLELHRALGDREGMAIAMLALSDIARDQGDTARLRDIGGRSLAMLRELGVQWAIGFALSNLALADYLEGDLPGALAGVSESVSLFRAQHADGSLAEVLVTQGLVLGAQGDRAAAYDALAEALRIALGTGPRLMVAAALEGMASLAAQPQHAELAARLLGTAASMRAQMGTPVRPSDRASLAQATAISRTHLGPGAFAAAWAAAAEQPLDRLLSQLPAKSLE